MNLSTLRTAAPYTRYYREENLFAVFVSNPERRVLLCHQVASRVGPDKNNYVMWDYHVVAVSLEHGIDGRSYWIEIPCLASPYPWTVPYLQATFRPDLFSDGYLDPSLQSMFRVVPASDLLQNFASDRSHMLVTTSALPTNGFRETPPEDQKHDSAACPVAKDSNPIYFKPPPPYPPICGSNA
ncbi:hypothetical protein RHOSPDRAFT_32032 [Rhodotorula sp. JG-1b]|nr:hypothetical protein RHOSPDRAFT_32032 [Rhodotorula sp. JG-1b]